MLPNKQKNKFYNPVKQNYTHLKWLQKYVGDQIPLFSIIVFSERCELKKVTTENPDIKVIKRDRTYATVREIWENHEDAVSNVDDLYEKLKKLTNVDAAVKLAHVANIEKRYKKVHSEQKIESETFEEDSVLSPLQADILTMDASYISESLEESGDILTVNDIDNMEIISAPMICPRCGNELVLRTARKGENAGKQFYGCSGFQKCRYVKNIYRGAK